MTGAVDVLEGQQIPPRDLIVPPKPRRDRTHERVDHRLAALRHHPGMVGALSARLGGSDVRRAVLRVVLGGALGLAFTYDVGRLFGTAIG